MNDNLVQARVTIEGTRPFLFHVFSPEILSGAKKEKKGTAGNNPDEWRTTYLATPEGQLYIRPDYVAGALINAAKGYSIKRSSYMTKMASVLQIQDNRLLFDRWMVDEPGFDPDDEVYLDVRGVVNPATRGRNVRYRLAMCPGWHTSFTALWDVSEINTDLFQAITIDAGRMIGLGDGRKGLGMGRFEVLGFEML